MYLYVYEYNKPVFIMLTKKRIKSFGSVHRERRNAWGGRAQPLIYSSSGTRHTAQKHEANGTKYWKSKIRRISKRKSWNFKSRTHRTQASDTGHVNDGAFWSDEVRSCEMAQHQRPFHVHIHHLTVTRKVLSCSLIWQLIRSHRFKCVGGSNSSVVNLPDIEQLVIAHLLTIENIKIYYLNTRMSSFLKCSTVCVIAAWQSDSFDTSAWIINI